MGVRGWAGKWLGGWMGEWMSQWQSESRYLVDSTTYYGTTYYSR